MRAFIIFCKLACSFFPAGINTYYLVLTSLPKQRHGIKTTDETGPVSRIFMDGVELSTTNIQNNMVNGTYLGAATIPLRLGARSTTGGGIDSMYNGVMDELAIYNRALTSDEILWLAQNSLAAIPEPASAALLGLGALLIARRKK